MRLIDIDKRMEEWNKLLGVTYPNLPCQMLHTFLLNAPTVDAVPVVHGRWTARDKCSECGGMALFDGYEEHEWSPYCPYCGAKMDGGAEG